ncbi:MAG: polyprenyl synthetase family protein [Candidatus Omnitrophica bacterium]|jgi:geranylgeranyl diphosphate synthase type I|nr:polyprenyl synthetase family protein [Candidatus Omnitrophota bacterium]MDD4981878.1 polyprenyl synthetase family protein [Candidatus Omnitrophota bacterium]MDD5665117.1 polyprenyl synthetase family protein [Candidatus Omnitrophota bacterium]
MFLKIKKRIDRELKEYSLGIEKTYHLNSLSPLLFKSIKEYILREGKRVRPILFCIGYLGFSKKPSAGLFRSAISLELLHDFMLIHDDIIDKSDIRRGKPAMHVMLNKKIPKNKGIKFNGQDMAIVTGDVIYAMALDAFLSIKEEPKRKELALKKLILAALYTGSGEFIELLLGAKQIDKVNKNEVYKIYDYKTANYTFASPLAMGATLAGADKKQILKLLQYGMCLGRAFQIKDDIIGTFAKSSEIGKSNLTDLAEAKKTILLWHAYNNCSGGEKKIMKKILSMGCAGRAELKQIRSIILKSKSLRYAKDEIKSLIDRSRRILVSTKIKHHYRKALEDFSEKILKV